MTGLVKRLFKMIFRSLSVREDLIIMESNGEFQDNTIALFDYMITSGINDRYRIVWLVSNDRIKARFDKGNT